MCRSLIGHQAHLHRRQPQRERAGVVLDQHAEEPLDGTEQRAMHHHRLMPSAVLAHVFKLETRRQIEVELHGRKLPQAAQHVDELDIDLRPVERRFARNRLVREFPSAPAHAAGEPTARFQFSSEPA